MANVLIDTDIVIEVMRSNQSVIEDVKNLWQRGNVLFCSPVTVAEVYHGLRSDEVNKVEQFFRTIRCLPVTKEVGEKAGEYLSKYHKSNGVELGDALIAAASFFNKTSLYTLNNKHYPMGDIKLL